MKVYEFKIRIKTRLPVKDIIWAISNKLREVFPIQSIDFKEVVDRPTSEEHHGGYNDLDDNIKQN
tara:strand:- start:34 stop:228 length:195 start_codon:yes stop_codon:yes gene_type:complete